MQSNKNIRNDTPQLGLCDFENYWGESLSSVEFVHFISGVLTKNEYYGVRKIIYDVPNEAKMKDIFSFSHLNGLDENYDYWRIKITTKSGKTYQSKHRFYCSLSESDNNHVILGVNGDAQTLYVAFPSSSGCSTKLELV